MAEHIVAIFDTEAAADAAARDLEAAGIPASAIRRYRPNSEEGMAAGRGRQQHDFQLDRRLLGLAFG